MSYAYGPDPHAGPPPGPHGPSARSSLLEPAKTDGVSIAAFVLSLLCCSPVALALSIAGIVRTKGAQRTGRWAAVAGLLLSVAGLVAIVAAVIAGSLLHSPVVEPGEARVGQCVKFFPEEDDNVVMREAECDEPHHAEIVGVTEVTDDNVEEIERLMVAYCLEVITDENYAKIDQSGLADEINVFTQDPDDVKVGDDLVCYVEAAGDSLYGPVL